MQGALCAATDFTQRTEQDRDPSASLGQREADRLDIPEHDFLGAVAERLGGGARSKGPAQPPAGLLEGSRPWQVQEDVTAEFSRVQLVLVDDRMLPSREVTAHGAE